MELTTAEIKHVIAAQGWIELGLFAEAFAELDDIPPGRRGHPDVLEVRWNACHGARQWDQAVAVARELASVASGRFAPWWMISFALHELKRTQEAYDNLAAVRGRFDAEWIVHYNLACYLVQLGRIDEARPCLARAFEINPEQRELARQDQDLAPLWAENEAP